MFRAESRFLLADFQELLCFKLPPQTASGELALKVNNSGNSEHNRDKSTGL